MTIGASYQSMTPPKPKTKYVLVPLNSVTKTISKFTTPEYQARRRSQKQKIEDYDQWEAWPMDDNVSFNRRPHSQSEGSAVDWKSEPRTWTQPSRSVPQSEPRSETQSEPQSEPPRGGKDRSYSADYPFAARKLDFVRTQVVKQQRNQKRNDAYAMLQQKEYLARHAPKTEPLLPSSAPSPSAPIVNLVETSTCLAPFNPEGGKLKDYAAYFFTQAYGLEHQSLRGHDEIIRDAHALTNCSMRAINEVLYGFSYDDVLGHLRAQVPVYPAKVPNKERNLDHNRDILLSWVNRSNVVAPRAHTAPKSPAWERAKQIVTFAAPAALLLSPFIF